MVFLLILFSPVFPPFCPRTAEKKQKKPPLARDGYRREK